MNKEGNVLTKKLAPCYGKMYEMKEPIEAEMAKCAVGCDAFLACCRASVDILYTSVKKQVAALDPLTRTAMEASLLPKMREDRKKFLKRIRQASKGSPSAQGVSTK